MRVSQILALLTLAVTPLHGQRRCKKGIPCGGSCISATKTCRIGSSTPTYEPARMPAPTSANTPAPIPAALIGTGSGVNVLLDGRGGYATSDSTAYFIAWPAIGVYFNRNCVPARLIPTHEAIYFRNPANAELARFVRSPIAGC